MMSQAPPTGTRPRSGRDLFMVPQNDRLNDQFRFIDTLVLSMTDSWAYLPPRAKHILWLKLASSDPNLLEQSGMPVENGMLLHWSMWPDDLGDYAQAISLRISRVQLDELEPKNVAMASALKQAQKAEDTARLQIQLAQMLIQLSSMGADSEDLARLFSRNAAERESISTVIQSAEEQMVARMRDAEQMRPPEMRPTNDEEMFGNHPDDGAYLVSDFENDEEPEDTHPIILVEEEPEEEPEEEYDGADIEMLLQRQQDNVTMTDEEIDSFAQMDFDEEGDEIEGDE